MEMIGWIQHFYLPDETYRTRKWASQNYASVWADTLFGWDGRPNRDPGLILYIVSKTKEDEKSIEFRVEPCTADPDKLELAIAQFNELLGYEN